MAADADSVSVSGHVSGYRVFQIDTATTIQAAVEAAGVTYTRGSGYYQIGSKTEQISATKKLVVLSRGGIAEDRPSEARALVGISSSGAARLSAAECGEYTVFVQSTSGNRQLKAGTRMLFETTLVSSAGAAGGAVPGAKRQSGTDVSGGPALKRRQMAQPAPTPNPAEEDPQRATRPPLVVAWMDRVDAAVGARFPKLLDGDRRIITFIKQVGMHQVEEMFAKQASGECQCIEASVADLTAQEWFGSDFYYEDNWNFDTGVLRGYEGHVRFPEFFPLDDMEWNEDEGYVQRADYDCEDLFVVLRQCVCDTIKSACCCKSSETTLAASDIKAGVGGPTPVAVVQVDGTTRVITTESVAGASFCSATGRLFCLTNTSDSQHQRAVVAFDAQSGAEVGRISKEMIAGGCHGGGSSICIGGRLLVFGETDPERFFQIYDCTTLHELYAGPHPKPSQYAHLDAIRVAKTFPIPVPRAAAPELQLFTGCYHYAQRWSLAEVIATPPGPPILLNEYKNTGNTAGSTHDFQVLSYQGQECGVARSMFVAADEQSIRVFDLAKSRCIKKGLSGWVQQLVQATSSAGSDREDQQRLICTGGSICGEDSIWSVSHESTIEKVSSVQLPNKGVRLVQHPTSRTRYFGIVDFKMAELQLDLSVRSGTELAWHSAEWKIVKELGDLEDRSHGAHQPWMSAEGRLYSFGRDGMSEWACQRT